MKTFILAFCLVATAWANEVPPHFFTAYPSDLSLHEVLPEARDHFCTIDFIHEVKGGSRFTIYRQLPDGSQIAFDVQLPISEVDFKTLLEKAHTAHLKPEGRALQPSQNGRNILIEGTFVERRSRFDTTRHPFRLREPKAENQEFVHTSAAGKTLIEMTLRECAKDPR